MNTHDRPQQQAKQFVLTAAIAASSLLAVPASAAGNASHNSPVDAEAFEAAAVVSWQSDDDRRAGTMHVALAGVAYQGRYFQIRLDTRGSTLTSLWSGSQLGWSDWPYWSAPNQRTQGVDRAVQRCNC